MSRLSQGFRSLISRILGGSGRRQGIADFLPQAEDFAPAAPDPHAPVITEAPAVASPPEPTSVASAAAGAAGLASIRLIFTDGTVVPLPEGSLEGRKAQYLARRVLEAGRGS